MLWLVLFCLSAIAAAKLAGESHRLVYRSTAIDAIDVRHRFPEVRDWFAGLPVYPRHEHAAYPPASYIIFRPLFDVSSLTATRWRWFTISMVALGWLVWLIVRESRATGLAERSFAAVIPLSLNAMGVALGNGQPVIFVLPLVISSLLIVRRRAATWVWDGLGAALFLIALVKPHVSAPFLWLLIVFSGRLRPAIFTAIGYLGLTALAAAYQPHGLLQLLQDWIFRASVSTAGEGYANLPAWLNEAGFQSQEFTASLLVLAACGAWAFFYRDQDTWLLLGVTGLVARMGFYHLLPDDILILFAMVALLRLSNGHSGAAPAYAATISHVTLLATLGVMVLPARIYHLWPDPWPLWFSTLHTVVFCWVLLFLLVVTHQNWRLGRKGALAQPG